MLRKKLKSGELPILLRPDNCSRSYYLEMRDADREFWKESERCEKSRRKPGFEKLNNLRYGG